MTLESLSTPPAATRLGRHIDLLTLITSHLDKPSQLSCLTVSIDFHLAAVPHVYRTIDFGYKFIRKDTKAKKADVGGTETDPWEKGDDEHGLRRYVDPFVGADDTKDSPFGKRAALRSVKVINLYQHETRHCAGWIAAIPKLQGLEVVHVGGGGRPRSQATVPCYIEDCDIVTRACRPAKTVVTRYMGSKAQGHIPAYPHLQKVILKIRPCQMRTPSEPPRRDWQDIDQDTPSIIDHEYESPFGSLSSATHLDLVFWDENHCHRVDRSFSIIDSRPADRDCEYHNREQAASVIGSRDLPNLMRQIGRWSDVKSVRVYNSDRTAMESDERQRGIGSGLVNEVRGRMLEGFTEGRRERLAKAEDGGEEKNDTQTRCDKSSSKEKAKEEGIIITFHSAREYYKMARTDPNHAMDHREAAYWMLLINPSEKVQKLRERLMLEPSYEKYTAEDIEVFGEEMLETEIECLENERRRRISKCGTYRRKRARQAREIAVNGI